MKYLIAAMISVFALTGAYAAEEKKVCVKELDSKTKKEKEAMAYIDKAIEKDPKNAALFLVLGNIYDGQANPKTKDGKDAEKPANFEELIKKAETNYLKALEIDPNSFIICPIASSRKSIVGAIKNGSK